MSTETTEQPIRVKEPRWNTARPQVYYHEWHGKDRIVRFEGKCCTCGRRTYGHDDGEDDPRGILGDHSSSPMRAEDYGMEGASVPQCFMCANEERTYICALELGRRKWSTKS